MRFLDFSKLKGTHAFLSPSQFAWLNYDDDKLITVYHNFKAKQEGTELHDIAARCIDKKIRLKGRGTIAMYVNDAIGYDMLTEVTLYFSDMCYGTADAISFIDNKLRIHDLKTGKTPAHINQLYCYAALFCLQYDKEPKDISIELRIYQSNDIYVEEPEPEVIEKVMDIIKHQVEVLEKIKAEEGA